MQVYFSLQSIPELQPLSANDRQRVWTKSSRMALFPWYWLLGCLFISCSVAPVLIVSEFLEWPLLLHAVALTLALAIGGFLFLALWVRKAREYMPDIIVEII